MRNWLKIIILIILIIGVAQFFRPQKNFTTADAPNDIAVKYDVPMNVLMNLYDGCYNCHSNYTKYPWYYNIQPVGWWMSHHINDAKQHVNFSEFASYTPQQAAKKFKEIKREMDERGMPLKSYLLMHKEAHLTSEQYKNVSDWAQKMEAQVQQTIDSTKGS
ncbi:MAG: heme-binding domain-containing protein [Chitinophagaceae bacterium]